MGNPKLPTPVANVTIELGATSGVDQARVDLCITSLSFYAGAGNETNTIPIGVGALTSLSSTAIPIASAEIQQGAYSEIHAKLSPTCGGLSGRVENSYGFSTSTQNHELVFKTPIEISNNQVIVTLTLGAIIESIRAVGAPGAADNLDHAISPPDLDPPTGEIAVQQTSASVAVQLTVAAAYPTAAKWMTFLKSDGTDLLNASGATCTGSETRYSDCFHAGELRKVVIPGASNCAGLALTDSLGAFDWVCKVISGQATFYNSGFKSGKGLGDLLDASNWKSLSVTLTGPYSGSSQSSQWWSNPVTPAPANPLSSDPIKVLTGTGTIYTVASSTTTSGYNLNSDRLALVVLPGATLTLSGITTGDIKAFFDGEVYPGGGGDMSVAVSAGAQKFLWIEGAIADGGSGFADRSGVLLYSVGFSILRQVRVSGFPDKGIFLTNSVGNRIISPSASNIAQHGVKLYLSSNGNLIKDAFTSNTPKGLYLITDANNNLVDTANILNSKIEVTDSSSNRFGNLRCDNSTIEIVQNTSAPDNSFVGLTLQNGSYLLNSGTDTIVSNATVFGSTEGIFASNRSTIQFATGANISDQAFTLYGGSSGSRISNVIGVNSSKGLRISSSSNNILKNLAFAQNNYMAIEITTSSSSNSFGGTLAVDSANVCFDDLSGSGNQLDRSTCNYGAAFAKSPSFISLTSSFAGKISQNDLANSSDQLGVKAYDSITDFFHFDNPFRGWGILSVIAFPDFATQKNPCVSGNSCQIWDWRLRASDASARNRNGVFSPGAACPASVDGSIQANIMIDLAGRSYLMNALEIFGDDKGNENGLCETGESCIFAPNFGSYQGEGDYLSQAPCTFTGTVISGVTMYGYPVNGAQ